MVLYVDWPAVRTDLIGMSAPLLTLSMIIVASLAQGFERAGKEQG
jgi:hypothetical protein